MIATEIELPETLYYQLQMLLDRHPAESMDSLLAHAIAAYLQAGSIA